MAEPIPLFAPPAPRRPTHGEHSCAICGAATGYGVGWPPATPMRWFCRAHLPPDFLPARREA